MVSKRRCGRSQINKFLAMMVGETPKSSVGNSRSLWKISECATGRRDFQHNCNVLGPIFQKRDGHAERFDRKTN